MNSIPENCQINEAMQSNKRKLAYLRRMTDEDLAAVMVGELQSYPFPWTQGIFSDCMNSERYQCLVFEHEARLSGHVVISAVAGEAHILNLCVYPRMQRQGWGRKLLVEAESIARQHKADTCFLEVRPSNHAGMHLYFAMGYNEVGMRKNYYPAKQGREDAIVMAKKLF